MEPFENTQLDLHGLGGLQRRQDVGLHEEAEQLALRQILRSGHCRDQVLEAPALPRRQQLSTLPISRNFSRGSSLASTRAFSARRTMASSDAGSLPSR